MPLTSDTLVLGKKNKIEDKKIKRVFTGTVVSDKMDKTIVVAVETTKINPKYKKRYKIVKRYKVHDDKERYKAGDKVVFQECRPLSKEKRWRVTYN
ncbi:MAG: 30S ribosomal protein S17 [Candidatus Kuenenbacteria bacterium]